jgi:hypothetical protein
MVATSAVFYSSLKVSDKKCREESLALLMMMVLLSLGAHLLAMEGLNLPPGQPPPIDPSSYENMPNGDDRGPNFGKGLGVGAGVAVGGAAGVEIFRIGRAAEEDGPAVVSIASEGFEDSASVGQGFRSGSEVSSTLRSTEISSLDKDVVAAREIEGTGDVSDIRAEDEASVEKDVEEAREYASRSQGANAAIATGGAESTGVIGNIVAKEHDLALLGEDVFDVPTTKTDGAWSLRYNWATDPAYRTTIIREIAEEHPEALGRLADRSAVAKSFDRLDPLVKRQDAIDQLVEEDEVYSTHSTVADNSTPVADITNVQTEIHKQIEKIVSEVLDDLPRGITQPTDAQLKIALKKALKPDPKFTYEMNVQTGKLAVKLNIGNGQISGEPNIYSICKKTFFLSSVVGGGVGMNKKGIVLFAKKYFGESETKGSENQ